MDDARKRVGEMKRILDRFVRAEKFRSDDAEREYDTAAAQVRAFPRGGILDVLDRAVGRSEARRRAAMYVLAELPDVPEAVERLGNELAHPDPDIRTLIIQTIDLNGWTQFAPHLNRIILEDPEERCRHEAIRVAGVLKQDVNFPVILRLADDGFPDLEWTLKDYGREEGRSYLRRVFEVRIDPNPAWLRKGDFTSRDYARERYDWRDKKGARIIAAWGLAKLADAEALEYLGQMLYDPDYRGATFSFPGQSLRAAQALADVFGLPFEGNTDYIEPIRRWWEDNKGRLLGRQSEPNSPDGSSV
jgi:HEAT repeat protein